MFLWHSGQIKIVQTWLELQAYVCIILHLYDYAKNLQKKFILKRKIFKNAVVNMMR